MAYNEITVFINQILDQKGMTGIESDVREQLVADLEKRLLNQINRAIVEAIPQDKLAEFEKLAQNADDAAVQQFLADAGVDTQKIATATMVLFKNAYIGANH